MAGKNRTFRTDVLTHPRTAGLHPLDLHILFFQCVAANIAGVLERSIAQIARAAGGGTTQAEVKASLRRMEKRGVVRWWPELDLLWAVEAADHQARTPAAWRGVRNVVDVLPAKVREAFDARYPDSPDASPKPGPRPGPDDGAGPVPYDEELGIRKQESRTQGEGAPPPKPARSVTPPKTKGDIESERRHQLARFREAVLYDDQCRPTPPGREQLGTLIVGDRTVLQLLEQGATAAELHTVARSLARRISSGELEADMWGGLAFSWPYPMLRDGLPIPGKSKPGLAPSSGPVIATAEAALAWAEAHGNRAPDGWEWREDGHGKQFVVRAGGAA